MYMQCIRTYIFEGSHDTDKNPLAIFSWSRIKHYATFCINCQQILNCLHFWGQRCRKSHLLWNTIAFLEFESSAWKIHLPKFDIFYFVQLNKALSTYEICIRILISKIMFHVLKLLDKCVLFVKYVFICYVCSLFVYNGGKCFMYLSDRNLKYVKFYILFDCMQSKNNNGYLVKKNIDISIVPWHQESLFEYAMLVHFYQRNIFEPFERKLNKKRHSIAIRTQFCSLEVSRSDIFIWIASLLLTKDKWNDIHDIA